MADLGLAGLELPNLLGDVPAIGDPTPPLREALAGVGHGARAVARACSSDLGSRSRLMPLSSRGHVGRASGSPPPAIADLPPVDALAPAVAADVPRVTVSVDRCRPRLCVASASCPAPPQSARCGSRSPSTWPIRSSTSPARTSAAVGRPSGAPAPPRRRGPGGRRPTCRRSPPTDLLVRRGAHHVHPRPRGSRRRPGAARHRIGHARPSRRRCPRPAPLELGYFVGLWEVAVERFAATLVVDIAHDDPDDHAALTEAVEDALPCERMAGRRAECARSSRSPLSAGDPNGRTARRQPHPAPHVPLRRRAHRAASSPRAVGRSGRSTCRSTSSTDLTDDKSDRDRGNDHQKWRDTAMSEAIAEMVLPGTYIEVRSEGLIAVGSIATGNIGIVGTAARGPLGRGRPDRRGRPRPSTSSARPTRSRSGPHGWRTAARSCGRCSRCSPAAAAACTPSASPAARRPPPRTR